MQPNKRIHLSIATNDLPASTLFYSKLLASMPVLERAGYAKFVADDPALNLSLIETDGQSGVLHAGVEVNNGHALESLATNWAAADACAVEEPQTVCCYHRSSKVWATDPSGVAWEGFVSYGVEPEDTGSDDSGKDAAEEPKDKPLPVAPPPCC